MFHGAQYGAQSLRVVHDLAEKRSNPRGSRPRAAYFSISMGIIRTQHPE